MGGSGARTTVRPATPHDSAFIAWGLVEAARSPDGRSLFDLLLGRSAHSVLRTVVAQPGHELSYEHAVMAETSATAAGVCLGWPKPTAAATWPLVRHAGPRAVQLVTGCVLAWPVLSAMARHDSGDWYLEALAVAPAMRGQGVGRMLMDDALARARGSGCARLTLDVDAGNAVALALYEKQGLRVEHTSRRAVLVGGTQVHRMAVRLSGGADQDR